jgi:ribonuclease E
VAVLRDGRPEQVYVEEADPRLAGNIYKGRIVNIQPSIQAAFVDFGVGQNGFLHTSDVEPTYYRNTPGGRPALPKPPIQDVFRTGQEVIVQVIKEGIGGKGATLSTYISIAGRYLVLMPCLNRSGVSRKVSDEGQRRRLLQTFNELKPPGGLCFILRGAAIDKDKKELQRDLVYLSRLWRVVARRIRESESPGLIYRESEPVTRPIRDTFAGDVEAVWLDEPLACEHAREYLQALLPGSGDRVRLHEGTEPLFSRYGIREESLQRSAAAP